jgi:RNA polymerase sigma-70 factor (ECF subfamily)
LIRPALFLVFANVAAQKQRRPIPFPSKDVTVSHGTTSAPTGSSSDADLLSAFRAGDAGAFEALYRRHASRVYSLACRIGGSPEDGEDLLQEIFLQAYRKIGSFKGDSALGTWLYRLALNHCLDFVRSRQAKVNKLTETLDADTSFEPAARRDTPIARLDLDRALMRLPDGCREAFVLHDVEGLDHKEVAERLGIAEGTSKSQVFKARLKLRALLK